MKIDCPHCGVHGLVDDSLAGKKLLCPKCSKVFLVAEEVLLDMEGYNPVRHRNLHDPIADEQAPVSEAAWPEDMDEPETAKEELEEELDEYLEESGLEEDVVSDEDSSMAGTDEQEVEAADVEGFALDDEGGEATEEEDDILAFADDKEELEEYLEESGLEVDVVSDEDSSMAGTYEQEVEVADVEGFVLGDAGGEATEEENDILAFADDHDDDDDDVGEEVDLEACDECGELLHPEFLETVDSEKYCALCLPEDQEGGLGLTSADLEEDLGKEDVDEIELEEDLETEDSFDSTQELMADDDGLEEEDGEGVSMETCSVCGDKYHPDFMQEIDSELYCGVCQPEVVEAVPLVSLDDEGEGDDWEVNDTEEGLPTNDTDFTVGELLKEAWQKTKGAKGSIWGGAMVMYLILLGIILGGVFGLMQIYGEMDPAMAMGVDGGLQVITTLQVITAWFSMLFAGGLMLVGVRRALEQRVSWKQVFAGFSARKIIPMSIAGFLQFVLILIGFALLVLPGIYLLVGYTLTLPLILDKGLGPWEALETSRKAIHKKWWTVFGLYIVMFLLYAVSAIPVGLGLIWTVPMFFVMVGVLYSRFFVSAADFEEEEIEELDEESEESV